MYVHDLDLFVTVQLVSRGHACRSVIRQALRRARIYLRVGQWSKSTSDQRWEDFCDARRKFRACCCPGICRRTPAQVRLLHRYRRIHSSSSNPASLRSDEGVSGRWRNPPKTKNQNKNKDNKGAVGDRLRDLSEWLQEFTENLEDAEVPTSANISHDSDSEHPMTVAPRKHSVYTHFPKDRNCEVCMRTKIKRALCRK